MKRYAIPVVVVLAVLAVTLSAFAQAQDRAGRGGRMSEEERARIRERYQNMSEEERAKFREQMRARGGGPRRSGFMNAEDQAKAIKAIEDQLAKLKAIKTPPRPQGSFQDMSEDERNKFRESMMKVGQERNSALQAIMAQVAALQGRRQPAAEGARYMILSTNDLRPIQEAAKKEKAEETGRLLQGLIARGSGRGFGGRGPGGGRPGGAGRPQGGGRRGGNQ
ncbi:MAG: hypothetical protein ACYSWO_15200 [Planctomycetota bacterium]